MKSFVAPVAAFALMMTSAATCLVTAATPQDQSQQLIDKGLGFLKTQQKPDGGWQNETEPPGMTAIVLRAFVQDGNYDAKSPLVAKGYEKLLSYQQSNGGIYKDMMANYNTSIAITALTAAESPEQFKERIDRAVAFLRRLQWNDQPGDAPERTAVDKSDPRYGGFGYGRKQRPDLSNTHFALEAFASAGIDCKDPSFQAAMTFLDRVQNHDATNDQPWAGNDGGFIYSSANGGESMAESFVGPDGQKRFRSYGSMTYAGLKSMMYAELGKEDPRVKAAFDWITRNWTLDENPGMREMSPDVAKQGLYYYYHVFAAALNAYEQPVITDAKGQQHDWRIELIDKLASLQKPDGSWTGEKRWMEDNSVLTTAYVVLALQQAQTDLAEHPPK